MDLCADDEDPSQLIIRHGWDAPHVRYFPRTFCAWPCLLRQVGTVLGSPYDYVLTGLVYANPGSRHPPFPSRIREHSFVTGIINKSERRTGEPEDQIRVDPQVAMVKDLATDDVSDSIINFCGVSTNIVTAKNKSPVSGTPVVFVKIGYHNYYGLCDLGSSASAIPYSLYQEIMGKISPCELEEIDATIYLANKETISPIGIVRDVEVLCGKVKYLSDFLILGSMQDSFCPIIFARPFLNTCGAVIDCKKVKSLFNSMVRHMNLTFLKFPNNLVVLIYLV